MRAVAVPGPRVSQEPPMLPPSPAVTQGLVRPGSPGKQEDKADKMETSETTQPSRQSPGSSPDTDQDSDFVLVPNSLAGDSSRNKNMHAG